MTYKELYDKAMWDLEHDNMTLGEFDRITEPLNKEIPKEEQVDRDLISRQAVLEVYDEWRYGKGITYTNGLQRLREQFEKLPSAEKTARWIPISERLPEEYIPVMASTKLSVFPETRYSKKYGWEWAYAADDNDWRRLNNIVIAWMPLPEPYKAESEGT